MTLSDLADQADGDADETIELSRDEARDIVEIVTDADVRRQSLIERNAELEAAFEKVAGRAIDLEVECRALTARVAQLETEAEDTRVKLAAALGVVTTAAAAA